MRRASHYMVVQEKTPVLMDIIFKKKKEYGTTGERE
jgi:hypothetical protein